MNITAASFAALLTDSIPLTCCCPATCYLTLPPPGPGAEYGDEAAAQAVLDDPLQVSNCIGFHDQSVGTPVSFTATDLGTSLQFAVNFGSPNGSAFVWAGITAQAGDVISFAFTGWPQAVAYIYDEDWNLIETVMAGSSPAVFTELADAGCYQVALNWFDPPSMDPPPSSGTATLTTSGTLRINTIRAAYDNGTDTSYLVCA